MTAWFGVAVKETFGGEEKSFKVALRASPNNQFGFYSMSVSGGIGGRITMSSGVVGRIS